MTALSEGVLGRHAFSVSLSMECCVCWLLSLKYAVPKVYQWILMLWKFMGVIMIFIFSFGILIIIIVGVWVCYCLYEAIW